GRSMVIVQKPGFARATKSSTVFAGAGEPRSRTSEVGGRGVVTASTTSLSRSAGGGGLRSETEICFFAMTKAPELVEKVVHFHRRRVARRERRRTATGR